MTYFSPPGLCPMSLALYEEDKDEDTIGQLDKRMKAQIDKCIKEPVIINKNMKPGFALLWLISVLPASVQCPFRFMKRTQMGLSLDTPSISLSQRTDSRTLQVGRSLDMAVEKS